MRAWTVHRPGVLSGDPLVPHRLPVPEPGVGEVLVRVRACGVCRTDLHIVEGDLELRTPEITPGHQIVGEVVASGPGASRFAVGDRIGVAWLRGTCGICEYCRRGQENLCPWSNYTGWDAPGGYAEYAVATEAYAYELPEDPAWPDERVAPLLCAGIIGYRALRRASLPPGGRLGIWGFGGSAHLAAQVAIAEGAVVHVFTRSEQARELALGLGAATAQSTFDPSPEPLDSALIFAPAGEIVPAALSALDRAGTCAVAGIHLSDVPSLDYHRHLFYERNLRSVTSNTRADGEEFLRLARRLDLKVATQPYALDDAARALGDLDADRVNGAAVLIP